MLTDDDIYQYLEHHGVKGMRWGVRGHVPGKTINKTFTKVIQNTDQQQTLAKSASSKPKEARTKEESVALKDRRINRAINTALIVGAGALAASYFIHKHNQKVSGIKQSQKNIADLQQFINKRRNVKFDVIKSADVKKAKAAAMKSSNQALIEQMKSHHINAAKEANKSLKTLYNRGGTAIKNREYLSEVW